MIKTNVKLQVTPKQSAKIQQICFDHRIYWSDTSSDIIQTDSKYLFIHNSYIIHMTKHKSFFKEHEFKEVDAELFIDTYSSSVKPTNKFEEYGFEVPNFQCKLYDKLDDYILGSYFNPNKQKWTMCRWGFDGRNKQGSHNYALTPILVHKPWYETCKFPILVYRSQDDTCLLITDKDGYSKGYLANLRPYTDAEIEELKRGY